MGDLGLLGRALIGLGLALAAIGLMLVFARQVPWLGKLPGDILIRRGSFTFYFPLATCAILSLAATLLLWFITRR